jgi:hypothetical protein
MRCHLSPLLVIIILSPVAPGIVIELTSDPPKNILSGEVYVFNILLKLVKKYLDLNIKENYF